MTAANPKPPDISTPDQAATATGAGAGAGAGADRSASGHPSAIAFAEVPWRERTVRIEYQWLAPAPDAQVEQGDNRRSHETANAGPTKAANLFDGNDNDPTGTGTGTGTGNVKSVRPSSSPLLVFLHEGLGSLSMWKDFPQAVCNATGLSALVYSRPGYGQSTPRDAHTRWGVDFMHQQAHEVLPALLQALHVDPRHTPLLLLGHSDGASIALLFGARWPEQVRACIVMAPHTFVEPMCVAAIAQARTAYQTTDLSRRLARYHQSPDSAFWGWNDIWLAPEFLPWNIDAEVARIRFPLLALQGVEDEYGTLEQIERIARHTPHTTLVPLSPCGHSPHRDQRDAVIAAIREFVQKVSA